MAHGNILAAKTVQSDNVMASVMAACKKMVLALNKNSIEEELRRWEKQALHLQMTSMHSDTGVTR